MGTTRRTAPTRRIAWVCVLALVLAGSGVFTPAASAQNGELCDLIGGNDFFYLDETWATCAEYETGSTITDYATAGEAELWTIMNESAVGGFCPDVDNPCFDAEYVGSGSVGDQSEIWRWRDRFGGPDSYTVTFRRGRFWVLVGDPDLLDPNVTMTRDVAETHAWVLDSRITNWLNTGVSTGSLDVDVDSTSSTASASSGSTSDSSNGFSQLPKEPLVDYGRIVRSVIAGGAVALIMGGGRMLFKRGKSDAERATHPPDHPAPSHPAPSHPGPGHQTQSDQGWEPAPPTYQNPPSPPSPAPEPVEEQWWN